MESKEKCFALLIDADNIGSQYIKAIIEEIASEGVVTYKRIYGDWTSPTLKPWKDVLLEYSIIPIQQYSYTSGKNSTDSAMIIDAMDILYSGNVDGFCLASSDSDFTRLAARLRESGKTVIGMGKQQTPRPFVTACSRFKYIDIISKETKCDATVSLTDNQSIEGKSMCKKTVVSDAADSSQTPESEIKETIHRLIEENSEDGEGWVLTSLIGAQLQKKYTDFDPKNYGFKKMKDLLTAWEFEIRGFQDPNNTANPSGYIMYVRNKQ